MTKNDTDSIIRKKVFSTLINLILLIITLLIAFLSLLQKSLVFDKTPYIEGLGLIFVLVYLVSQRQTSGLIEFSNLYTQTKEMLTQISNSELESTIFKAIIKSGKTLLLFALTNLLLTLVNIIVFKHLSWGNIIFSSLLIWPLFGKFQIREELKCSIYSGQTVKHILHKDSIEIFTDTIDTIHQKIMLKDLKLFYKTSQWLIFKRKKYPDYIILENRSDPNYIPTIK